ncbi:MAG TPA: NAD-dependent epimerase/dehydratase family protein, partial [Candidatus Melainabacteria bacterium]|nr:NAD-dependent epimerase/dehydratase family protein [Candidatus Melainabacteria bacterium]
MRVLVIGGTGFIGSYVVSKLNQAVDEVYVLHRGRTDREFPSGVKSVICDRSKQNELSRTMTEVAPDVVIDMIPRTAQETWSVLQ